MSVNLRTLLAEVGVFRRPEFRMVCRLVLAERSLLAVLLCATFFAALTEGIGIGVLVPILDSLGTDNQVFSGVPLIGRFLNLFQGMDFAQRVQTASIWLIVIAAVRVVTVFASQYFAQQFRIRIERKLRERAMKRALVLDFEHVSRLGSPVLLSHVMGFTGSAASAATLVARAARPLAMLLLYSVLCLALSWKLTLVAGCLLVPAVILIRLTLLRRTGQAGEMVRSTHVNLNRAALGLIYGIKTIRLNSIEDWQLGHFGRRLIDKAKADVRLQAFTVAVEPAFQFLTMLILAVLLLASAITYGDALKDYVPLIILFLFVLIRMSGPIQALNSMRMTLESLLPSVRSLFGYLEESEEWVERSGGTQGRAIARCVEFRGIGFRYHGADAAVLEDLSFEIPARRMTALVGYSGAGKSTVVNLLCGLLKPTSGSILVDGESLGELDQGRWRSRLGVVAQDSYIFDDTVEANLRMGRDTVPQGAVESALKAAQADEFIDGLPEGLDTEIGERGIRLSGGQQQRLVLARAILNAPELLILDEATSHLDAVTEHAVQEALDKLQGQTTILAIAHRLSTVRRADEILVLDKGRIVERGSHTELLAQQGMYAHMVQLQMLDDDSFEEARYARGEVRA